MWLTRHLRKLLSLVTVAMTAEKPGNKDMKGKTSYPDAAGRTNRGIQYNQTDTLGQLEPSVAVRLRGASAYERLKNTKHHSGFSGSVMSTNQCFRLVHVKCLKFLLTHKKI